MRTRVLCLAFAAVIITTLAFLTVTALSQEVDVDKLRKEAETAMAELRYREALGALEQVEKSGEAELGDREKLLTCLLKLREEKQFKERLEAYLSAATEPYHKARYGALLIAALEGQDRWDNRQALRKLYQDVYGWYRESGEAIKHKQELADFLFAFADFLGWDDGFDNMQRTLSLLQEVIDLSISEDYGGRALLETAQLYDRYDYRLEKTRDEVTEAFREVYRRYPKSDAAATALLEIGGRLESDDKYVEALAEYDTLLESHPTHAAAKEAKQRIENIKAPRLQVYVAEIFKPGDKVKVSIRYRNVKKIDFAAHRFELLDQLREKRSLIELGSTMDLSALEQGAAWSFDSADDGKHHWYTAEIEVPLSEAGAYIVLSRCPGVTNRALLLVSGLASVVKSVESHVTVYCADALSGAPAAAAEVVIGTDFYRDKDNEKEREFFHTVIEGKTDEGGLWDTDVNRSKYSGEMLVVARRGNDYALSEGYLRYWYGSQNVGARLYLYTDRPVYRPGQQVHFKAIVRAYEGGVYRNVPGETIYLTASDAQGQKIKDFKLTTNEFGTAGGDLMLPEGAPLGQWNVSARCHGGETYTGFRVEEYKKPEFIVGVATPEGQYRLGGRISAEISAVYYFGEPVVDAQVEYEIVRSRSWWWHRWQSDYDWLYEEERPYYGYWGRDTIHRGAGKTDAEGKLSISFPTAAVGDDDREVKLYDFTIVARVTDASRREIRGATSVKVSSHEFGVRMRSNKYVYKPGDTVKIDFSTSRFDGKAVASRGKMVLYRCNWDPKEREYSEEKLWENDAATAEDGKGAYEFTIEEEGYLVVRYEAADAYDMLVRGGAYIWVSDDSPRAKFFPEGEIDIVPDNEHYFVGQTARLLVNSRLDDAFGLLTVEGGYVMKAVTVSLHQGANIIELPITEAYEPNVFVKLTVINNFQLHSASKELLVPPEEKFARLTVIPSKEQFQPGEKGRIRVEARDWQGNPLQAEFSIGVVDTALYYIAPDETPDIRAYFYGQKRYDNVITNSSFEFRFRGLEEEADMKMMKDEAPAMAAEPGTGAEMKSRAMADEGGLVQPEVRKDFRDSALWLAEVRTGADGAAEVEITWPDNLTTWQTTVRAVTTGNIVGNVKKDTITRKNLMVRLQTPRFLVQGDRVTLSVNVHNYLESAKRAKVSIEAEGLKVRGEHEKWMEVEAGGEVRLDVEAVAESPGSARILAKALTDEESDAMELTIPVYIHGIEKFAAAAGTVEGAKEIELNLPEKIRPGSARLRLSLRPTIAGAMLDSLPFLIDYPYGCTEQTMSRFLPAAVVAKTLKDLGLERPDLEEKLPKVIRASLDRLYDFQHDDGGWGWWKHDSTNTHMTAYVVYGLTLAKSAGIEVDDSRLKRGIKYLRGALGELEDEVELLNFVLFAVSWSDNAPERYINRVFDLLPKMDVYETALFAVTLHNMKKAERFDAVMEQLAAKADIDSDQGITSWGKPGGWYWYQDNVEATALALMAQLRKDPKGEQVLPTVRWLLSVRKGGKWKSTRDTAFAVFALTEFIKSVDEFNPDFTAAIEVDGREVKRVRFTRENLFSEDGVLELGYEQLRPGAQRIRIVKDGRGNLYYDAFLTYFSLEERITAASTTIAVERSYFKKVLDQGGNETVVPLKDGDALRSGDEIEVRLKLTSQNNYEYLVYEDFKPAGCEPLRLRSGYTYGSIASNLELRDEKVVFFIGWLPKGAHEVTYELRAEVPGLFHALPTNGYAMYAPDVRAISDEHVFTIRDVEPEAAQ